MLQFSLRLMHRWIGLLLSRRRASTAKGTCARALRLRFPLQVEELEPRTAPSAAPTLTITGPADYSLHKVGDAVPITFTAGDSDSPGATIDFYYDTDKIVTNGLALIGTAGTAGSDAITIGGAMSGTVIVAGISPGTDTVSGNDNDVVISASIQGAVTALTLKGAATGSTVVAHGKLGAGFVMINGQEHELDWTDPFSNIVVKQDWNQ